MWQRNLRFEPVERDRDGADIAGIGIGHDRLEASARAPVEIGERLPVRREDAVLRPHLDREIAEHQAILERQRPDARSCEFECLIVGTVGAELARER